MATVERWPDFLAVGAPKCGTTALYSLLRQHPDLFVAEPKEPHFFCTDVPIRHHPTAEEYLGLFERARPEQRAGEVSVWYLYSRRSARAIHEACGSAQILVMLRDPVQAMASLHAQYLYNGDEPLLSLAAALEAEEARSRGGRRPESSWVGPECLCYRRVFDYAEQIERYLEVFGPERVHVTLFEDFVAEPAEAMAAIHRFLGVEPVPVAPARKVNPRKEVRFPALRSLHRRYEGKVRRMARRLLPVPGFRRRAGRAVMSTLRRVNARRVEPEPLPADLVPRLREELAPGIHRLEEQIGRDLSAWLGR